jgi:hypothetical protein
VPSRAGSPNKNKQALIALLELKYPGYNPVVEMAKIATDMGNDLSTRFAAHKEVAQYITPKLKAVEVNLDVQGDIKIGWSDTHRVQSETASSDTP